MSATLISTLLRSERVNTIPTLSLDTTLEYVLEDGRSVVWPPATQQALHVNHPSILISNIMWKRISWYPTNFWPYLASYSDTYSQASKDARTFFIYLWTAVYHSVFPFYLSIAKASSTDLGTSITKSCVVRQYLAFSLAINLLRHFNTSLTHHLKAGCTSKRFPAAYSANSTGLDDSKSLSGIQLEEPPLHSTKRYHSHVVFFGTMLPLCKRIMPSEIGIANRSFLWLVISCSNW